MLDFGEYYLCLSLVLHLEETNICFRLRRKSITQHSPNILPPFHFLYILMFFLFIIIPVLCRIWSFFSYNKCLQHFGVEYCVRITKGFGMQELCSFTLQLRISVKSYIHIFIFVGYLGLITKNTQIKCSIIFICATTILRIRISFYLQKPKSQHDSLILSSEGMTWKVTFSWQMHVRKWKTAVILLQTLYSSLFWCIKCSHLQKLLFYICIC